MRAGELARLTVGAVVGLPPDVLPRLLGRLRAERPDVAVVTRAFSAWPSVATALARDGVDAALVRDDVAEPGLRSQLIYREAVGIALPVDHPLAARETVDPADLRAEAFVSFPRDHDPERLARIFGALRAVGLDTMPVIHESAPGAVDASLRLVATRAAVSPKLASKVAAFRSAEVVWRPVRGLDLEVVVSAAWRWHQCPPAVARLVACLSPPTPHPSRRPRRDPLRAGVSPGPGARAAPLGATPGPGARR